MEKTLSRFSFLFYAMYFVINIIGLPFLQFIYLPLLAITYMQVLKLDLDKSIYNLIIFSFIEGQGRVIFGYNFVINASIDILTLIILFRAFLNIKNIFVEKYLPFVIKILIALHLMWWFVELFHPYGLEPWFSVLTIRYYILPLIFFLLALNIDIFAKENNFQKFCNLVVIFYIAEIIIVIFQFIGGQQFLKGISPNYLNLFASFERFQGSEFRAFGTSFVPGGYASHLYLATPLLFYGFQDKKWFNFIGLPITILMAWSGFFLSGVRSAWIKNILIVVLTTFFLFIRNKFKFKNSIQVIIMSFLFTLFSYIIFTNIEIRNENYDLTNKISRVMQIISASEEVSVGGEKIHVQKKEKHRLDFEDFLNYMKKVEFPFGSGIGMGGANVPGADAAKARRADKSKDFFWTGDNLYFFLIFEMGIGALFFISFIFILPFYYFKGLVKALISKEHESSKLLIISFSYIITLIVGNWGGVSLVFPPESMFFGLICGLGLREYFKLYHSSRVNTSKSSITK